MGRKNYSQQAKNDSWNNLPKEPRDFIEKYLDDPIIPQVTTDEIVEFMKSGIGMQIVKSIIQYGKMYAKEERERSTEPSQEQIKRIRAVLGV